ncbi:mitochondrial 54S ribosomal protein uL15m [Aspergillus lucknowensis]|uniref:Ribosomal protein L18e/L15P n=1 Tax=Aspergillus lucknowensis TaxID=176173 RepID=A0ABR4LLP4_9EURO
MPPRLQILPLPLQRGLYRSAPSRPSPLSLLPALQQPSGQSQSAHILASLSDTPGAYNKRIRRGRGPASGKGKTSGRGHKGQKQHGKVPAGFNGGQTPEIVVHGERGFNNVFALDLATTNLDRIQEWIDQGRIDPTKPITIRELAQSRCIHNTKEGVKLLANGNRPTAAKSKTKSKTSTPGPDPQSQFEPGEGEGEGEGDVKASLKQPVHIVVSRASASAIAAVEAAGGSVTTRFYTRASIARIMKRETHPFLSSAWCVNSGSPGLHVAAGLNLSAEDAEGSAELQEEEIMAANGFKYRLPDPTKRRDIEYYRDPAHRGYLSHLVKPLEGPSLFFRSPAERQSTAGVKKEKVLPENRLW